MWCEVKELGVRDWRQCEQRRGCPRDAVVCGLNRICTGCTGGVYQTRFSGMQLVCASCVPQLKLPCPRASLVFSWRQVAAFLRLGSLERAEDPSQLLRHDSTLRCLLITQGSLLRDLCREHPAFQSFLTSCSIAINDEAQQGGQAGSFLTVAVCNYSLVIKSRPAPARGVNPQRKPSSRNSPWSLSDFSTALFLLYPRNLLTNFPKLSAHSPLYPLARPSRCPLPIFPLTLPHLPLSSKPLTVHQAEGLLPSPTWC